MALSNLISIELTNEERQQIDTHLTAIETLLKDKCINLTPEQRQEHGKLGNRTENWVKKVSGYMGTQPSLTPVFIDKQEFDSDYEARQLLLPLSQKLSAVNSLVDDTMLLLGADLYNNALAYYKNIKVLASQNVAGAKTVYDDLSAQFPGRPSKKDDPTQG